MDSLDLIRPHRSIAPQLTPAFSPRPANHPAIATDKIGVLLVNLGTPDGYDFWSVRRYLAEFLSDPRVVELPRWLWQPLLHGVILMTRPQKSGAAYARIWDRERNESPLRTITRAQAEATAAAMADSQILVRWAMRYGAPSIAQELDALKSQGCGRILVVPLYPQYSASTNATVVDAVGAWLKRQRLQPAIRYAPAFHDDPSYISALAIGLRRSLASLDWTPDLVVASYHGIPKAAFDAGDPYHCHCLKTSRLLREEMGWSKDYLVTTFQSRFGPREWLKPYTAEELARLAQAGVKKILILTPGFMADCLETKEEIAIEAEEIFLHAGGERFAAAPCLNDAPESIDFLERFLTQELCGWL